MIQSMTGYGIGKASDADLQITAELKSLNSRNAEIYIRLPPAYFHQEIRLKNLLAARLERGKISMVLTVERQGATQGESPVQVNTPLLKAYYTALSQLQLELGDPRPLSLESLLGLPGVVAEQRAEQVGEDEWKLVQAAVDMALDNLLAERNKEGAALQQDLQARIRQVRRLAAQVPQYAQGRVEAIRSRITAAFGELGEGLSMSEERLQQELIYYLEKYDINEEQVRLAAHLDNFDQTLDEEKGQGRKLLFIVQERWREVNTLGVKSYDLQIQNLVVQMKDELEKLKEQLMNIL
ncbi:MAG: YicC/YloC family endoribonuclease [Sphingobacteriia bacterium]